MTTPTPAASPPEESQGFDPGWKRVGDALKEDRRRRGMERSHVVARIVQRGSSFSVHSLAAVEQGRVGARGGVSADLALRAVRALDWPEPVFKAIKDGTGTLPPLSDLRAPKKTCTAAHLAVRVDSARTAQVLKTQAALGRAVEDAYTDLVRLATSLTALNGDADAHQAAARRMARNKITTWVLGLLADLEDQP